jgi:hypothetical protein
VTTAGSRPARAHRTAAELHAAAGTFIRDSKAPGIVIGPFDANEMDCMLDGAKKGEFDKLAV